VRWAVRRCLSGGRFGSEPAADCEPGALPAELAPQGRTNTLLGGPNRFKLFRCPAFKAASLHRIGLGGARARESITARWIPSVSPAAWRYHLAVTRVSPREAPFHHGL